MLSRLTSMLIAEDNKEKEKELFIESAILQSNMENIKRYSLMECGECGDTANVGNVSTSSGLDNLATALATVKFDENDTEEDKKQKLLALFNSQPLNELREAIETDKKTGLISMTKEDFEKVKEFIDVLKTSDNKDDVNTAKKALEKFVKTVAAAKNKFKDDENHYDAFINGLVDKLYKLLNGSITVDGADNITPIKIFEEKVKVIFVKLRTYSKSKED